MHLIIAKSTLENILIHAQPFLEKKDTSQITSHILFQTDANQLIAKATDHEIGLTIESDNLTIKEAGAITANGRKFLDIVKILKDSDVELKSSNNILHISQEHSNFKLPTFNAKDYPQFPTKEGNPKIEIDSNILIESLRKITPATDTNNPKFELNGALIDIKNDHINFVSTDTRRLAIVNIGNVDGKELALIIPKKAIIEIQKLFKEEIEIYYDNAYIIIQSSHYTFFSKLINGKFPDYSRIIPKEIKYDLLLNKADMIQAIKQITTISNDLKITFEPSKIVFESLSDDNIEAKTELAMDTTFDQNFTIAVNSRYLLDFIAQITTPTFHIGLNDTNQPFLLFEQNFKTIVMPIVI